MVGLVGVILFGISAGVSWFVILPKIAATEEEQPADEQEEKETMPAMPDNIAKEDKPDTMPVALRPEIPVTVEAVTELAQSIRKKENQLLDQERRLKKEEKRIGLLFEDLKQERDELTAFSQQIDSQVIQAREALEMLKLENQTLTSQKQELSALEESLGTDADSTEDDVLDQRVETVKSWFEKLEATAAANYLKEFADRGDLEFSAKLIHSLDARQKAKVLAAINDPPLVAQIVDAFTKADKPLERNATLQNIR